MAALNKTCLSLAGLLLCCTLSHTAAAHDPFEITTQGTIDAQSLVLLVTLAQASAQRLAELEPQRRPLTADDLQRDRTALVAAAARFYEVSSRARALPLLNAAVKLSADNDVELRLVYERPEPGLLRIRAKYLERLEDGYGNALVIVQDRPRATSGLRFMDRDNSTLDVQVLASSAAGSSAAPKPEPAGFGRCLSLGVEHLITGYDHLLFLASLLLVVRGLRATLALVTCFTLAHSVTLALASLDQFSLPASVVEPLIAASIVCVALDNLLQSEGTARRRLVLTLGFGLIHGFGFATVLRELGLGGQGLATAMQLFAFNLGIELGQIAIAGAALPLLSLLRRQDRLSSRAVRGTSLVIACFGAYWFVERVVSA